MHYYYPEHLEGYERIKAEGKSAWDELHGQVGFDNFSSRGFLEAALPRLTFLTDVPVALEYGCGTGPGACFLTERGFCVDAIDLAPQAIEIAKEIALQRGLRINFKVADVCDLPKAEKQYDLVVDTYCLQCIVFDDDRKRVFSAVQSRLKPGGYYLVSTAILDREHEQMIGTDTIKDPATGVIYTQYGTGLIDASTGIAFHPMDEVGHEYSGTIRIAGRTYLPSRRHLRSLELEAELESAGYSIEFRKQDPTGMNLVCRLKEDIAQQNGAPAVHSLRS